MDKEKMTFKQITGWDGMATERAIKLDIVADIMRNAKDRLFKADRTMLTLGDYEMIEGVAKAMNEFMDYAKEQIEKENTEE